MGPKKTNTPNASWLDKFNFEPDHSSDWLDLYRRHLSWIKSSEKEEDGSMLNDLASEI